MALPPTQPSFHNAPTVKREAKPANALAVWVGWGLIGIAFVGAIWTLADMATNYTPSATPLGDLANVNFRLFPLAFAIVSALIVTRQPHNVIGWLMALPVFGGLSQSLTGWYLQFLPPPTTDPSPLLLFIVWLDNIGWVLFVFPILLIPLVFPTGRPPTPRWNWVAGYAIALLAVFFFMVTTDESLGPNALEWTVRNPLGLPITTALEEVILLPWIVGLMGLTISSVAALVVRYRRGSLEERAQIRWVVYASVIFGLTYLISLPVSEAPSSLGVDFASLLFSFGLLGVPTAIGIAILHYRLWDIDFVINRSLVYGALTALLLGLFGVSLLVVNLLFQNFVGGPLVAVAVAAAGFGVSFQPARRRLQRFVDKRFYHIQIDYNKTPAPAQPGFTTRILKQTIFRDYKNLELIGRGGMAEVYKSTHPTLGTPVAIKVLPPKLATDDNFRKRFLREAKTVTALEHPNIIRVFDYGEEAGTHYMVMEYIQGQDLGKYLTQVGRLPLAMARPLLTQLASALDYAHAQGLVHRDIKPSNVLLDVSGQNGTRPVLTDFGIAKILRGATRYTETGGMLGTFEYIAPEQIQGATDVDARADVYSFGVMTFELLTGALPFQHANPGALLMAHMIQPPPDPRPLAPTLTSEAVAALQRAMAKKPDERFATAGEFIAALG